MSKDQAWLPITKHDGAKGDYEIRNRLTEEVKRATLIWGWRARKPFMFLFEDNSKLNFDHARKAEADQWEYRPAT